MVQYDFKQLMSPRSREMQEAKHSEIERLYGLPDRWLARELVTLSRHVVRTVPGRCMPGSSTAALLFEAIPEIAARLGETTFLQGERSNRVRQMDGRELREFLSAAIKRDPVIWQILDDYPVRGCNAYSIIANDASNGNPVVFGIDRFAEPDIENLDRLAWEVYIVSGNRGHDCAFGWRPEFSMDATFPGDWFVAPEVRI
ncbi:hypothetical protein [Rhizobium sp. BK176]|uniref:hypothetical protein n=1 Tax=Rhizobium sp. BK176 TaxID=2587071 RepID=UPI002167AFA1|nr:hypothetical protein [Rhizobium sp. BK176]MCS4088820.1 hypothetical protein [Rhizobium sp. BK176]